MRNLIVTAIVSAAVGCAAGYALAPGGESDTNAGSLADGTPGSGQVEAGRGREPGGGPGMRGGGGRHARGGRPGMSADRGEHGHGGRANAGPGTPGRRDGAFAGRGPRGRGQRRPGAPERAIRPANGFDLADLERSLAHMSVELTLEDAQQQAIRDVMQVYRRRMRELHEAISAALTPAQREKLREMEASRAGSPAR